MKILESKYPLGSLPGQKTPGRYIDGTLHYNLTILAKSIVRDMTFLSIISSSTLENGTGKSVLATQIGEAWTDIINTMHKQDIKFTMDNVVFKPKNLIERAFKVPKYSLILLDEWEDQHYWSELGMSLRQFFRKCRQLNLFIIIIIPNFFQLPINYAVSRSVFFIDVRFEGEFERGYFRFYSFNSKKRLYLLGKKTQNYDCVRPDFTGRFTQGYGVDEEEYRAAKLKDMNDSEEDLKKKIPNEKEIKVRLFKQLYERLDGMTIKRLADGFGISERTGNRWLQGAGGEDSDSTTANISYLTEDEIDNKSSNLLAEATSSYQSLKPLSIA